MYNNKGFKLLVIIFLDNKVASAPCVILLDLLCNKIETLKNLNVFKN